MRAFGIGLSGTGCSGLSEAFEAAYISSIHCPRDRKFNEELFNAAFPWSVLDIYDGVTGVVNLLVLDKLIAAYPDAKYVITHREKDEWLRYMRRSWDEAPDPIPHIVVFQRAALYGTVYYNEEQLADRYDFWTAEIDAKFAAANITPLKLDITGGEGWEKLAPFLGVTTLPAEVGGALTADEKRPLNKPKADRRTYV